MILTGRANLVFLIVVHHVCQQCRRCFHWLLMSYGSCMGWNEEERQCTVKLKISTNLPIVLQRPYIVSVGMLGWESRNRDRRLILDRTRTRGRSEYHWSLDHRVTVLEWHCRRESEDDVDLHPIDNLALWQAMLENPFPDSWSPCRVIRAWRESISRLPITVERLYREQNDSLCTHLCQPRVTNRDTDRMSQADSRHKPWRWTEMERRNEESSNTSLVKRNTQTAVFLSFHYHRPVESFIRPIGLVQIERGEDNEIFRIVGKSTTKYPRRTWWGRMTGRICNRDSHSQMLEGLPIEVPGVSSTVEVPGEQGQKPESHTSLFRSTRVQRNLVPLMLLNQVH